MKFERYYEPTSEDLQDWAAIRQSKNIYNSESYARELAESREIKITPEMTHEEVTEAIEEWEEENC